MGSTAWSEDTWSLLVARIRAHQVTPILGAGASIDIVGGAIDIAGDWARSAKFPFDADPTLAEMAQYIAITLDRASAGEYIKQTMDRLLSKFVIADIEDRNNVYRYLPSLDFPIWITTNYDDLIERGLRSRNKSPHTTISAWTPPDIVRDEALFAVGDTDHTVENPLVFHLHGSYVDELSMVITESDYLEFLEQMAADATILPPVIRDAMATTSLLFVGYGFRDLNLQLLLRQWRLPRAAYAVQPLPDHLTDDQAQSWMDYYPKYLKAVTGVTVTMYWGTASDFCADLAAFVERSES